MLVAFSHLVAFSQVEDAVKARLFTEEKRKIERQAYICQRIRDTLDVTKFCSTKQQWLEHNIIMGAVMPAKGDGMITGVAEELNIRFGSRNGRERLATKCMRVREEFDKAIATLKVPAHPPLAGVPLREGETVLSRGMIGELVEIYSDGRCSVLFKDGDADLEKRVDFLHSFGRRKGSARLQRPPPSLHPNERTHRSDTVKPEVLEHVQEVYESMCPESPHQRDIMKRRVRPHLVQVMTMHNTCLHVCFSRHFERALIDCACCELAGCERHYEYIYVHSPASGSSSTHYDDNIRRALRNLPEASPR